MHEAKAMTNHGRHLVKQPITDRPVPESECGVAEAPRAVKLPVHNASACMAGWARHAVISLPCEPCTHRIAPGQLVGVMLDAAGGASDAINAVVAGMWNTRRSVATSRPHIKTWEA